MAHRPTGTPAGVVVLTHGAGGSRESPLLIRICDEWAGRGWLAVRYNLPYRRRRPKGPPSGSAAGDRDGILEAIAVARTLADGPVIAGGHSYGGRQTSMVVAENPDLVEVLTLFSYPLHPPGKPERLRVEHFPGISVPCLFISGDRVPFGSPDELEAHTTAIAGPVTHHWIAKGRHDLVGVDEEICEVTATWLRSIS